MPVASHIDVLVRIGFLPVALLLWQDNTSKVDSGVKVLVCEKDTRPFPFQLDKGRVLV